MLDVLHRFALLVDTLAQKIKPGSESIWYFLKLDLSHLGEGFST